MPPLLLFMAFESLMRQIQDSLKPQDGKTPKKPRPSTKPNLPTAIPSSENRERAATLRDQGWSKSKIAKELGVSPATVSRYLHKPSNTGSADLAA
jgi:DNA invertase Pin-like site-specific DNA recombinase